MKKIKILLLIVIFKFILIKTSIAQSQFITSSKICEKMWKIEPIGQKTNVWCYAAATEMILKYYDMDVTQCQIVATINNKNERSCESVVCPNCTGELCTALPVTKKSKWIKELVNKWKLPKTMMYEESDIKFSLIKCALDECKPVIFAVSVGTEMTHALVIAGYIEKKGSDCDEVLLLIKDPAYVCQGCNVFMIYNKKTKNFNDRSEERRVGKEC